MDIQKWLNETVLPHQAPSSPEQHDRHQAGLIDPPERPSKVKRRRKESSSDSSLLDHPPPHRKKATLAKREDPSEEHPDESVHNDASDPTNPSGSSVSSQPYKRKPRRKTRPERYDPMAKDAKERGTHPQRHKKGESKMARHKPRRMKASKPGSGIVQSFHAKNVPKDRLTIKPREKLGLFSKGRVSSPVKGRGLPDLVFSEMKFLQKHKDQPEAGSQQPASPKKRRKKDQAHAKEKEISAYFNTVRPALAERDSNAQAREVSDQRVPRGVDHSKQERSSIIENAVPTIEPVDKTSYLGFGGRGPRHESAGYISWSESARAPSATAVRPREESVINSGQLNPLRGQQAAGNTDGAGVLYSLSDPQTLTGHFTDGSGGRFQVSSLPPTNERTNKHFSRSRSLPQHTSSPRRINLVDRAKRRRKMESIVLPSSTPAFVPTHSDQRRGQSQSYHTPSIPISRNYPLSVNFPDVTEHRGIIIGPETEHPIRNEAEKHTSSSLGRILQDCNTAFHERRRAEAQQPITVRESALIAPVPSMARSNAALLPAIRRIPTVRFAGEDMYPPRTQPLYGPSIYEQQEQRQYGFADPAFDTDEALPLFDTVQHGYYNGEELDIGEPEWDEDADLAACGINVDPTMDDEGDAQQMDNGFAVRSPSQSYIVAGRGFWRPHKLY